MQHPPKHTSPKLHRKRAVLLAALLLLALAAALLWYAKKAAQPVPVEVQPSAFQTLEVRDAKELDTVTVHPRGADSYTLKAQEGRLYLQTESGLEEISDAYANELLEVFTHIVSQDTVTRDAAEVEDQLADMGLAPAMASAEIRYADGSEALLEVGADVPNTTYAYCRWSGDAGVYMCDVGVKEVFALTRSHLMPVVQPAVHTSLVEEVTLANEKGLSRFRFENGAQGRLAEPYAYPLSDQGSQQLLRALANFRLGTLEASVTQENRAFYGLDDPLCTVEIVQKQGLVNQIAQDGALNAAQVEAQAMRFVIGREESDYFYTCEYEGRCYLVSRFLVEALVKADREAFITRNPASMGDAMITSVMLEAPQGTWAVDALRAERVLPNNQLELDENGQPVYDLLVLVNGEERSQELFTALCDRLHALTAAGDVPDSFVLSPDAQPRWSLTVETTGAVKRQIDAYRMDAFSDALMVDGVMRHYVHADAIDVLINGLD